MKQITVVALSVLAFFATTATAETYIVPMWASVLTGADGQWYSQVTAVNPNSFPVTYRITRVFPLRSEPCAACTGTGTSDPRILEVSGRAQLYPPAMQGVRLVAAALEIEASGPLGIQSVVYGPGHVRQHVDVARRWIRAGTHFISTVEQVSSVTGRTNVFVTNPGSSPIEVSVWAGNRSETEVRATVPAQRTAVVQVIYPNVPRTTEFPPRPDRITIESSGEVLTSASSVEKGWAVFTLADEARQ
jgi:hypothetical protein